MTIPFHCPWVPSFVQVVYIIIIILLCYYHIIIILLLYYYIINTQSVKTDNMPPSTYTNNILPHSPSPCLGLSFFCHMCQTVEFMISFFSSLLSQVEGRESVQALVGHIRRLSSQLPCSSWWVFSNCIGGGEAVVNLYPKGTQPTIELLVLSRLLLCCNFFSFSVMKMRRTT